MAVTRVLFIQRSIPPDHSAAGALLLDLARGLDPERFRVTILAAREPADAPRSETVDGVEIRRVGISGFSRRSTLRRLAGLLGTWLALVVNAFRVRKPDVVVTLTDPPLLVVMGALVARLRGCRHVHWAQDLYPQVAAAGGVLPEESPVYRLLERMALEAMKRCDEVVAVGRCMAARLRRMGVLNVSVVANWSRISLAEMASGTVREIRREWGGPFVVLYSGNLGIVHEFETLLSAAGRCGDVLFVLAGDGPRRQWLESEISRRGLKNVRMLPSQPWDRYPALLAATDVSIVTLRPEFAGLVVPSKVYDAAAALRPIVFLGSRESEAARLIEDAECGVVIPDGEPNLLAVQLMKWKAARDGLGVIGEKGATVTANASRAAAISAFSKLL